MTMLHSKGPSTGFIGLIMLSKHLSGFVDISPQFNCVGNLPSAGVSLLNLVFVPRRYVFFLSIFVGCLLLSGYIFFLLADVELSPVVSVRSNTVL